MKKPGSIWTRERDKRLRDLLRQCGPTLCRTVIAMDLGMSRMVNAEKIVRARLKEMGVKEVTI